MKQILSDYLRIFAVMGAFWMVVVFAVVWAQEAHADGNDEAFIRDLRGHGLTFPNDDYALNAGHSVCADEARGLTDDDIVKGAQADPEVEIGPQDVQFIVDAAEKYFCPQFADKPKGGFLT